MPTKDSAASVIKEGLQPVYASDVVYLDQTTSQWSKDHCWMTERLGCMVNIRRTSVPHHTETLTLVHQTVWGEIQ